MTREQLQQAEALEASLRDDIAILTADLDAKTALYADLRALVEQFRKVVLGPAAAAARPALPPAPAEKTPRRSSKASARGARAGRPGPAKKRRRTYGNSLEELSAEIEAAIRSAGRPLRPSEMRAAVSASEWTVQRAVREMASAGRLIVEGQTSQRTFRLPGMPAPERAQVATAAETSPRQLPRPSALASDPELAKAVRTVLKHGASVTASEMLRQLQALGHTPPLEVVKELLEEAAEAGRVERIPVGRGVRYRPRA